MTIQKHQNETVYEFNQMFNKLYNRIPSKIVDSTMKSIYLKSFDPKNGYELKRKNLGSLAKAQKVALTIKNNRKVVGMIGKRIILEFHKILTIPKIDMIINKKLKYRGYMICHIIQIEKIGNLLMIDQSSKKLPIH
jgi:hypothetical protein